MTQRGRRALFWVFVVSFFLVAPLLIFYALGYRFDADARRLVKTGTLIISSRPRGATVLMNGLAKATTPATIRSLLPDTYDVRLELEGRLPWQKRIELQTNEAAFISDVRLFHDVLPTLAETGEFLSYVDSGQESVATIRRTESGLTIDVRELRTGNTLRSALIPAETMEQATFSPDGRFLAFDKQGVLSFLSFDTGGLVQPLGGRQLPYIRWDWGEGNELYAASESAVYAITPTNYEGRLVDTIRSDDRTTQGTQLTDIAVDGNQLYELVLGTDGASVLRRFALAGGQTVSIPIAGDGPLSFVAVSPSLVVVRQKNGTISFIDVTERLRNVASHAGVTTAALSNSGREVVYSTEFELWTYDLGSNRKELLQRTAAPIEHVAWHPSGGYIIYATGTEIVVVERDSRDVRNSWVLGRFNRITDFTIDRSGQWLEIIGTINEQGGVYRRPL